MVLQRYRLIGRIAIGLAVLALPFILQSDDPLGNAYGLFAVLVLMFVPLEMAKRSIAKGHSPGDGRVVRITIALTLALLIGIGAIVFGEFRH